MSQPLEALGGPNRLHEAQTSHNRFQEAQHSFRKPWEDRSSIRRPERTTGGANESRQAGTRPRGPKWATADPGNTRQTSPRRPQEARTGPTRFERATGGPEGAIGGPNEHVPWS